MASVFSKIIAGDIPCFKIAENENYFAFLDINPLTKGHTLVVPKVEIDYIFDLNDEEYLGLHQFAKKIAIAIKKSMPCERVGVCVMGMEVPHAHIHLIPFSAMHEMNFANQKLILSKEEMQAICLKINNAFLEE
jgi:histidine triad (HIT) family protein